MGEEWANFKLPRPAAIYTQPIVTKEIESNYRTKWYLLSCSEACLAYINVDEIDAYNNSTIFLQCGIGCKICRGFCQKVRTATRIGDTFAPF
jgi:hypothetical protein